MIIWAIVQVVLTAVLTIVSKLALIGGVDPLNFSWQTLLISSGLLLIFWSAMGKGVSLKLSSRVLTGTLLVGLIGGGLAYALSYSGLKYSSAVNYSFLTQSSVLFSAVLAWLLLKERMERKSWVYMLTLLVGIYLVATSGQLISINPGDSLIILGSVAYSLALIISKKTLDKIAIVPFSIYRALFGGLSLLVVMVAIGSFSLNINWTWALLAAAIIAVGIIAMNKVIARAGVTYLAITSATIPVATAGLSYIVLGEILQPIQLFGAGVIVISTLLIVKQ